MFRGKKKSKKKTEPIPTTIDGFGYVIKEDGTVRSKTTDSQYVFEFEPKNQTYNETRYRVFVDLLGDVVEEKLQQAPFHFQKVVVPLQANDAHTYFYMTPNALTTKGKLVLFIPGTQTRIGQWSKRVMCEESIQAGSMMDMAEDMINRGYEVILMNPNGIMWYDNAPHDVPPLKSESWSIIPGNESPEAHCLYVFQHFVRQAQAEKIGVVALGYGGHCFTEILNEHFDVIKPKVVGVAIANTGHLSDCIYGSDKRAWMYDHVVNWTVSDQTKGENVPNTLIGCASVSAGPKADLPEYVLWKCAADMAKFIGIKMGDVIVDQVDDDSDDLLAEDDIYMEQEQLQASNLDDPDRFSSHFPFHPSLSHSFHPLLSIFLHIRMEGLYHNNNNLYPSSSPYMIPHPDHSPYYSPTTSLPCRTGAPHSAFSDVRPPYSASSSQQHSDSLALSTSSSTANNTTPTPTGWSSSPTSPGYSWSGNYSQHPPPPSYHHHPHHHAPSSSSSSSLSSSTPSSRPHPYSSSTSCYALATHTPIQRPKLTTTVWEDEGTVCYQVDAKSVCVARRQDNDMINGTKLLNVVGMSRGKRDGILKNEKGRVVVKVGAMHLKGVWITFERAKDLAAKFKITDLLYPLFTDDPSVYLCPSTNGSMLPPPTMVPSTRPAMAFKPDPSFGFPPWDRSTDSFTNILRTNDQEPGSCSPDHDMYLMNPPPYDRPAFRNNNTTYDYDTFARKPMIKPPSHLYPHSPPHDEQQHSRKRSLPSSTPPPPDAQSRTTLKRLKTLNN